MIFNNIPLLGTRLMRYGLMGVSLAIALNGFGCPPVFAQTPSEKIVEMERDLEGEFETYFGRDLAEVTQDPAAIAQTLAEIGEKTGTRPAVIWAMPREDSLHLVLIRPNAAPIVRDLYDVSSAKLADVVGAFVQNVTNPRRPKNLQASQQLYRWLIQPFEAEFFQPADIDTLLFCLGDGLRGVPLAALHDGDRFLIEKYAIARIPAFNLIAHDYQNIQQGGIVAMGASEFTEQSPLPAVPLEIKTVINQLRSLKPAKAEWQELALLNSDFTRNNLQAILANRSFDIVHIATHADFAPGEPSASYIQFDDGKLTLPQMAELPWAKADVNLLVLSACRTAFGDSGAELGFAGLALEAGVDSAIASQWYVSDAGTLALMGEFYQELSLNTTKAEALRQAQLKMLRGEIEFTEDQLFLDRGSVVPIPQDLREDIPSTTDLSHPYYWAAFSLISSPW